MKLLFTIILFIGVFNLSAQYVQTIRGKVIDKESQQPLIGVTIALKKYNPPIGTTTDNDGEFKIENISIGKHTLTISYMGYKPQVIPNLDVISGKQTVLNIELEEQVHKMNEIVVKAYKKGETINRMAIVSARSFSVEETELYAGSLGDPARMASNFAGVSRAGDDRNDIVIRGNSPTGLQWKLEGVDIENLNHWGASGNTGGAISILNNNTLSNSDFFTAAFPAEYNNALSGVFDLKMRSGNNQKTELIGQVGFNGFEFMVEGPFSKKYKGSYLFSYRYSVLEVMDALGFKVAGGAIPEYHDLTYKINLPTKKIGNFSIFGITGQSYIEILADETEDSEKFDTPDDVNTYNGSDLFITGITHKYLLNSKSYINSALSYTTHFVHTKVDSIYKKIVNNKKIKEVGRYYGEKNKEDNYIVSSKYVYKKNAANTFSFGISLKNKIVSFKDSIRSDYGNFFQYQTNVKNQNAILWSSYGQWNHKFTDKLSIVSGLAYQHFSLSNSYTIEPRLAFKYSFLNNSQLSLGYGLHSRIQPIIQYFVKTYNPVNQKYTNSNKDLDFTKSHHVVFGYNRFLGENFKLKLESYYQYLFNVPVEKEKSNFSMLNEGAGFHLERIENLENKGLGENYGVELTLEKYLKNNWYMLVTGSLFESKYRGSDKVWRNTAFAGNFALNCLGGYEYQINKNYSINTNLKVTWSGGKRNLYIDQEASKQANDEIYIDEMAYSKREKDYFRLDFRLALKHNLSKFTQEFAVDLTNLTNHKNIFSKTYNISENKIDYVYQQGLFIMFLYRINFGF